MSDGPPGKEASEETSDGKPSDKTDNSGTAKSRRGQWQVASEPGDRETLTNAAGEKFPSRYERQLSGYYRSLAEGQTP